MEYPYYYSNLIERKSQISIAEGLGLRMLHDNFDPSWVRGEEPRGTMTFTDEHEETVGSTEPPRSTHFAKIVSVDVNATKPLSVVREWGGELFYFGCLVTQDIVDGYIAGKIGVDDYVLVHFDQSGQQVAMSKIFKTW